MVYTKYFSVVKVKLYILCLYVFLVKGRKPVDVLCKLKFIFWFVYLTLASFQVITRIIASACPVFYWFVAHLTFPKEKPSQGTSGNSYTDQNGFNPIQHSYLYQYNILQPNRNNPLEKDSDILEWDNQTWVKKFIMTYFHLYLFVGTAAFSNFLPWT